MTKKNNFLTNKNQRNNNYDYNIRENNTGNQCVWIKNKIARFNEIHINV